MSVPSFHLCPALQQERDFRLPTDQRGQSSGHRYIETPPGSTFVEDLVHVDGLSHTSEGLCSQVLASKIPLHQARGRVTDHNRIGLSQSLQPRCQVRGLAQGKLLLSPTTAHFTDNDQSSMNTHTESKLDTFGLLQTAIEVSHRREDTQARAYCSVRI